jgi:hypothetical protein
VTSCSVLPELDYGPTCCDLADLRTIAALESPAPNDAPLVQFRGYASLLGLIDAGRIRTGSPRPTAITSAPNACRRWFDAGPFASTRLRSISRSTISNGSDQRDELLLHGCVVAMKPCLECGRPSFVDERGELVGGDLGELLRLVRFPLRHAQIGKSCGGILFLSSPATALIRATTVHLDPACRADHSLATIDNTRSACRHCHGVEDAPRATQGNRELGSTKPNKGGSVVPGSTEDRVLSRDNSRYGKSLWGVLRRGGIAAAIVTAPKKAAPAKPRSKDLAGSEARDKTGSGASLGASLPPDSVVRLGGGHRHGGRNRGASIPRHRREKSFRVVV